jgi:hAT family C-terminal dimerisation region
MASSVSSERAFSSAGITLSKRRNRLQADIVEALQFLKCMFHSDLIFREVCTVEEEELLLDHNGSTGMSESGHETSWEELLIDANDIAESDTEL